MSEITTEEVRLGYATWMADVSETTVPEHLAEFDLWFAEVTKAAYLDGLADGITTARRIGNYSRVTTDPATVGLGRPESPRDDTGAASVENHPPGDPEPVASAYPTDHAPGVSNRPSPGPGRSSVCEALT